MLFKGDIIPLQLKNVFCGCAWFLETKEFKVTEMLEVLECILQLECYSFSVRQVGLLRSHKQVRTEAHFYSVVFADVLVFHINFNKNTFY